jgi:serine/threonine protein kinase
MWQMADENGRPLDDGLTRVPVVAAICLCEAMAAFVCLMAHGQLPDDQGAWPGPTGLGDGNEPNPPWAHNIIHRDIKPANYFLTECRDPTRWRGLPIAALIDFGNGSDARNAPFGIKGMGAPGHQAPKQEHSNNHPVTSATNVFQVGLVMHETMTLRTPSHQPTFQPRRQPLFPNIDTNFYPEELAAMARRCIRSDIRRRPTPKVLYMSMRDLANKMPTEGSRHRPWGNVRFRLIDNFHKMLEHAATLLADH